MVHITIDYKYSSVMLLVMSLAHPEFEGSVNPISTGCRLCPPHFTACPSGFETLTVSLVFNISHYRGSFDKFLCPNPSFKSKFVEIIEYAPTYFIFNMVSSENNKKGFIERQVRHEICFKITSWRQFAKKTQIERQLCFCTVIKVRWNFSGKINSATKYRKTE